MDNIITQELVKQYFNYLPETGQLVWIKSRNPRAPVGKVVAEWTNSKRKNVQIFNRKYYVHQLIYIWHHGYLPQEIDHIDRDKHNNRIENLRACTSQQNNINKGLTKSNTSGFKGVSYHKQTKKYIARLYINRVRYDLGLFSTKEQAALAYDKAAIEYFGEFAHLNLPLVVKETSL